MKRTPTERPATRELAGHGGGETSARRIETVALLGDGQKLVRINPLPFLVANKHTALNTTVVFYFFNGFRIRQRNKDDSQAV